MIVKFTCRGKRQQSNIEGEKTNLDTDTIHLSDNYEATVIQTVRFWWKYRQTDQWHRIDTPGIDSHKCNQLIFDKRAGVIYWRKEKFSQKLWS